MKTLQKYANIAFLLLSVATIVPAYANPTINEQEQTEQTEQEKTIVEPQKNQTREKIGTVIAFCTLCAIYGFIGYTMIKYLTPAKQDPFNVRLMNANIETKKLLQNYNDLLQMSEATIWELPATHKDDFLKAITAMYNKYGIRSTNKLYPLVDGSILLNTDIFK